MTTEPASSLLVFRPLDSGQRDSLKGVVVGARGVVEGGVGRVFEGLGVGLGGVSNGVPAHLSDAERVLRLVVLAKRRQLGSVEAVVEETAFGVWHRMLFARFLAENGLLIHPELGEPVTLAECVELAADEGTDGWSLASRFAAGMLPGLFPLDDPLAGLELLPEDLAALEGLLGGLPVEVFTSDDGLGWVYQFWQSQRKDEVNKSEVKIGARELPAVTQLFTEHYMVRFLLENSLGAWWAARHPDSPLVSAFEYLRFTDDGLPAAGVFEGWPDTVAEVTVMDPCCGSGHFLTAAFEMLWRMRVEEEALSPVEAQDAVLGENLFGLELDPRCTQIAAFNLALTAWKAGDYRVLPIPNIACSGIRVAGSLDDWLKLAGDDARLRDGLEALHAQFKDADALGSLINPRRASEVDTLMGVDFEQLEPLLHKALTKEETKDPTAAVFGHQAEAVAKAATLLSNQYTLVSTNFPYLGMNKQGADLFEFLARSHEWAKADLATAFLDRQLSGLARGGSLAALVPSTWLFVSSYQALRIRILDQHSVLGVCTLGPGAFSTISGEVVQPALVTISRIQPTPASTTVFVDVAGIPASLKASRLRSEPIVVNIQREVANNPDCRLVPVNKSINALLEEFASSYWGIGTGDGERFLRTWWEVPLAAQEWEKLQRTFDGIGEYEGRTGAILWEEGSGSLFRESRELGNRPTRGDSAWHRNGIAVRLTGNLPSTLYTGEIFQSGVAAIIPKEPSDLAPIWAFCSSSEYRRSVRSIDPRIGVMNHTLLKVPFDVAYWRGVAEEEFPDGLPEPWSDDPTQWLFLGDPAGSTDPLQVGVARLLGYSWPDQEPDGLDRFADSDGVVCLPAVAGERRASERLRELLVAAFEPDDPAGLIDGLLVDVDAGGKGLDWWLRERFFKQHCSLFHNRPFLWHVWDGLRDGFSALVNYHKLDHATLQKLTYSHLGWWIDRQKGQVREEKPGAEDRLAAALGLQEKLKLILEGEPPYDIYVRWKELWEQPVGWEPDLNDGVRLNVRPFVEAGVLRAKFNVKWGKDRGRNPDGSERLNDLHYTRAQKQAARTEHQATP
jgi:hypothetical protein